MVTGISSLTWGKKRKRGKEGEKAFTKGTSASEEDTFEKKVREARKEVQSQEKKSGESHRETKLQRTCRTGKERV